MEKTAKSDMVDQLTEMMLHLAIRVRLKDKAKAQKASDLLKEARDIIRSL